MIDHETLGLWHVGLGLGSYYFFYIPTHSFHFFLFLAESCVRVRRDGPLGRPGDTVLVVLNSVRTHTTWSV